MSGELFDSNQGVLVECRGKEWAEELELGVTAAGPDRVQEGDHYMESGFDLRDMNQLEHMRNRDISRGNKR